LIGKSLREMGLLGRFIVFLHNRGVDLCREGTSLKFEDIQELVQEFFKRTFGERTMIFSKPEKQMDFRWEIQVERGSLEELLNSLTIVPTDITEGRYRVTLTLERQVEG